MKKKNHIFFINLTFNQFILFFLILSGLLIGLVFNTQDLYKNIKSIKNDKSINKSEIDKINKIYNITLALLILVAIPVVLLIAITTTYVRLGTSFI